MPATKLNKLTKKKNNYHTALRKKQVNYNFRNTC